MHVLFFLLLLLSPAAAADWTLRGEGFTATVRESDGSLARMARRGAPLLGPPVRVLLEEEGRELPLAAPPAGADASAAGVRFTQTAPELTVLSEWRAGADLTLTATLRNHAPRRRAVSLLLAFHGLPETARVFTPSTYAHAPRNPWRTVAFGYRAEGVAMVFPAAVFYTPAASLTVHAPLAVVPTTAFAVQLDPAQSPRIGRLDLRLEPHGETRTEIRLTPGAGDWRGGLALLRDRNSDKFRSPDVRAPSINGSFVWAPLVAEEQVRQWRAQGVRWVEIIFTHPFVGEFYASKEPWTPAMDDQWHWEKMVPGAPSVNVPFVDIRAWMERRLPPWVTFDRVRQYIRVLHKHGIKAFIYFQTGTCWEPYARDYFPGDIARARDGDVVYDWLEDIGMNPRDGGKWGAHLEDQFKKLIAAYPEVDGVYMDQSHFDYPDFAHDDGFTLIDGRPAYRIGYAISQVTQKLVAHLRSLGKMVWWGAPWHLEIGHLADGHLAEASESVDGLKYLALGFKGITTGAASLDGYDRALLAGAQPAAPILSTIMVSHRYARETPGDARPPADVLEEFKRYQPMFDEVREREWVLEPHAISTPAGFESNLFRQRDGTLVAVVVTDHADRAAGWRFDVPVTLRLPPGSAPRTALWRSDWCSVAQPLPVVTRAGVRTVTIPRHRRASQLVLGAAAASAMPSPACAAPPFEIGWLGEAECYPGTPCQVTLFVAGAPGKPQPVNFEVATADGDVSTPPAPLAGFDGRRRSVRLTLTPRGPGEKRVRVSAAWAGRTAAAEIPVQVWRTRFRPEARVVSARLEFEGWLPDGSPDLRVITGADQFHAEGAAKPEQPAIAPRAVQVNGRLAGYLPSLNSARWRNLGPRLGEARIPMMIKLPPAVVVELGREVEVEFLPHSPRDDYRLRHVALRVKFNDGSTVTTPAVGTALRTLSEGASGPAKPIRIRLRVPGPE